MMMIPTHFMIRNGRGRATEPNWIQTNLATMRRDQTGGLIESFTRLKFSITYITRWFHVEWPSFVWNVFYKSLWNFYGILTLRIFVLRGKLFLLYCTTVGWVVKILEHYIVITYYAKFLEVLHRVIFWYLVEMWVYVEYCDFKGNEEGII